MAEMSTSLGARVETALTTKNPVLRLALGACPLLAVATRAASSLGMGVATACALVCAALFGAIFGKITPEKGRLPVFLLICAAFAGAANMVLQGWFPAVSEGLGLYAPMIAVSCLFLGGAGRIGEDGIGKALADAVGMGVGFICLMTALGAVRELIGCGTVFGAAVLPAGFEPMLMLAMPAGGFLALGLLMGVCNAVSGRNKKKGASA